MLRGLSPGAAVDVTLSRAGRRYCVDVNGRSTCGLGYTLGMGWTFVAHSQVPSGWPHVALDLLWMVALLFPFGFWLRWRWESLAGALLLAMGIVLPCALGGLSATPAEIAAALIGILGGGACSRGLRNICAGHANCF